MHYNALHCNVKYSKNATVTVFKIIMVWFTLTWLAIMMAGNKLNWRWFGAAGKVGQAQASGF